MNTKDQLSWEDFKNNFRHSKIKKVLPFNRMLFFTDNFFVIAGYGSFIEGYLLIITKKMIPSFAFLKSKEEKVELKNLIEDLKKKINRYYNKDVAIFEHGMCSCVGGLDRAHLHLMPIKKHLLEKNFELATNQALKDRRTGIEKIYYNEKKFSSIDDIDVIYHLYEKNKLNRNKIKIVGKLKTIQDLKQYSINLWPMKIKQSNLANNPYIFFLISDKLSFLTDINLETQFGRQVVFNLEMLTNKNFKNENSHILKKIINPWRWQESICEENIIKTVNKFKEEL